MSYNNEFTFLNKDLNYWARILLRLNNYIFLEIYLDLKYDFGIPSNILSILNTFYYESSFFNFLSIIIYILIIFNVQFNKGFYIILKKR